MKSLSFYLLEVCTETIKAKKHLIRQKVLDHTIMHYTENHLRAWKELKTFTIG